MELTLNYTNLFHTLPRYCFRFILMLSSSLPLGLRTDIFPSCLPAKIPSFPTHATSPAHFILCHLITATIFGGEHKFSMVSLVLLLPPFYANAPPPPNPLSVFLPHCAEPSFAPIQNYGYITYSSRHGLEDEKTLLTGGQQALFKFNLFLLEYVSF